MTTAARPPSSGWANTTSGLAKATPRAVRPKRWKKGDATASGCAVAQVSCQNPGRVSSCVRQPPPIVAAPSTTSTRSPAALSVTAAARPFGPLPTTTASNSAAISVSRHVPPSRRGLSWCAPGGGAAR